MRVVSWIAVKASRLFLLLGGLCALALVVAFLSYIFGERGFPAPFEDPAEDASFGTYAWQVGAILIGCWLLWQFSMALVIHTGSDVDVIRAAGRERELEERVAIENYMQQPIMARCTACEEGFRSWDEALEHAENVHGHNRMPEEARALVQRL